MISRTHMVACRALLVHSLLGLSSSLLYLDSFVILPAFRLFFHDYLFTCVVSVCGRSLLLLYSSVLDSCPPPSPALLTSNKQWLVPPSFPPPFLYSFHSFKLHDLCPASQSIAITIDDVWIQGPQRTHPLPNLIYFPSKAYCDDGPRIHVHVHVQVCLIYTPKPFFLVSISVSI